MHHLTLNTFTFLLFALFYTDTESACRHSYMTFCDDLSDLNNNDMESWTSLVVGTESGNASQLKAVDFDTLSLDKMVKVTTLIIINQIKDIKTYTFTLDPYWNRLNYLQLYGNDIKRIRYTTFDTMKLRTLSLVNNNIEYIHKGAFYNCEIQTIDLSHNLLEMIENDVFSEEFLYNSTTELVISHNRLETIVPGSFPSSLEILNLDHNNLNYLRTDIFENLQNLQELTMSYNRLSSLGFIAPLQALRHLVASHNNIIGFNSGEFNNLTQMEVIDLSHNQISNSLIFQKFNFPKRHPPLQISLAFNRFTHLVIEDNNFRHHIVFLYGNPWNCKCWQILEKFMVNNKVRRDPCDLQFFGNGEIPYCIDYDEKDCKTWSIQSEKLSENELKGFLDIVKSSLDKVKCRLTPRRL